MAESSGFSLWLVLLVVSTALLLVSLAIASYRFWQQARQRSASLEALNNTLNFHLEQERALRYSNERFLEFSRDILCSLDAEGTFLQVSPACRAILGYTPEELQGLAYRNLLVPEDQASTGDELARLVSGEYDSAIEFRARLNHRNGQVVTIAWIAEWSAQDQTLFCVGRDISNELVAEILTQEREQFFALSPDMFCIIDLNSYFFEMNARFVDTLGYTRDELMGTSYLDLVHPEDRNKVQEAVWALSEGIDINDLKVRILDQQGEAHWLDINAILSADDLIYVVARDTTAQRLIEQKLKESEALLRMAERVAMLGGWAFDLDTGKSIWSDAVCAIHGVRPGQTPSLEHAQQLYIPEHRPLIADAIRQCVQTGESFDEEVQVLTGQSERWVRIIGHAVYNEDGHIHRLQGACQDITAFRKTMEQLEATMNELERSNRELEDFAFVASHDLQEPLRKIQAFSDRLVARSEELNEREKDYLRRMQSAAGRMQALIEDLLSYSRVTTRAKPMVSCDTEAILRDVLTDMETSISRSRGRVDAGPLPSTWGDATQLRQVLQNLLSNAIKFHAPDRPPVVSVQAEDIGPECWTLVVSDNGIGFDERYAEKLFHPFQRLHQREGYPGTGIGMAIVKKILDRHGASVTLNSKPGAGTTFRIRLRHGQRTS
ncbi:MAG TPA: PAS domain-containing protein [Marinobacter sp.]|nr:PAS domain-containing protein [Marinobacter sp.]